MVYVYQKYQKVITTAGLQLAELGSKNSHQCLLNSVITKSLSLGNGIYCARNKTQAKEEEEHILACRHREREDDKTDGNKSLSPPAMTFRRYCNKLTMYMWYAVCNYYVMLGHYELISFTIEFIELINKFN